MDARAERSIFLRRALSQWSSYRAALPGSGAVTVFAQQELWGDVRKDAAEHVWVGGERKGRRGKKRIYKAVSTDNHWDGFPST